VRGIVPKQITQSVAQIDTPIEIGASLRRSLAYILWLGFFILGNATAKVNMKREEKETEREKEREKKEREKIERKKKERKKKERKERKKKEREKRERERVKREREG
jgi:hypothetical protein